jgi:hypothetical protein
MAIGGQADADESLSALHNVSSLTHNTWIVTPAFQSGKELGQRGLLECISLQHLNITVHERQYTARHP